MAVLMTYCDSLSRCPTPCINKHEVMKHETQNDHIEQITTVKYETQTMNTKHKTYQDEVGHLMPFLLLLLNRVTGPYGG